VFTLFPLGLIHILKTRFFHLLVVLGKVEVDLGPGLPCPKKVRQRREGKEEEGNGERGRQEGDRGETGVKGGKGTERDE
jgi:hypothetical protein